MSTTSLHELPVDRIACGPQVREHFNEEGLAGLAQSMREVGMLLPIRVRPDGAGWIVIDGERRLRAAKLAGLAVVPAIVDRGDLSDADVIQRQTIANCQREDLRPIEKAKTIRGYMNSTNLSAAAVAAKLGLSPASVSKLLALLVLPPEMQAQVEAGTIAASTAYEVVKTRDPNTRARLADEASKGRLTRRRAVEAGTPEKRAKRSTPNRTRFVVALGGGRTVAVAGGGLTTDVVESCLDDLLQQVRSIAPEGLSLKDIASRLSMPGKKGRGHE